MDESHPEQTVLSIDSDAPTEHDTLNRGRQIEALAEVIQEAPTPLVIALYGSWGTGKTSMMRQIRRRLDPDWDRRGGSRGGGHGLRTVWFDPWMHQNDPNPALGLLHATTEELGISDRPAVSEALRKIALAMAEDIQLPLVGVKVGRLMKVREELSHDDFRRRSEAAQLKQHFGRVLSAATDTSAGRLVYFIDDLDRCQPDAALSMLEALKLYLDFPNCVYVLGVDREPLEAAVTQRYSGLGLRTESYLDKIVQLPFVIPSIDEQGMAALVEVAIPDELDACRQLVSAAAADVPRDVKRVSNALLLGHRLAKVSIGTSYRPEVLATLILFQSQVPELYELLRGDPKVIHDLLRSRRDEELAAEERTGLWQTYVAPRPRLERALETFDLDSDFDLVPYLTLTASTSRITAAPSRGRVASDDADGPVLFVSSAMKDLKDERDQVREAATSRGWTPYSFDLDGGLALEKPGQVWRRELERADALAALIGDHIGAYTQDEIEMARGLGIPVLVFVKEGGTERDADTERFLADLTDPARGVAPAHFETLDDLRSAVERSLVQLASRRVRRGSDTRIDEGFRVSRTDEGLRLPPEPSLVTARRREAPSTLPPNFGGLIGRDREIQRVLALLDLRSVALVALVGPPGAGKGSILRELAHLPDLPKYPSGTAVSPNLQGAGSLEDVQQAIWDEFFDTDGMVRIDPGQRRRQLRDIEASFFIRHWPLGPEDLELMAEQLPSSVFVVAVEDAPSGARRIAVRGLQRAEATELFEREYGREIPEPARESVAAACAAVGGLPGHIVRLASQAWDALFDEDDDEGSALVSWLEDRSDEHDQLAPAALLLADTDLVGPANFDQVTDRVSVDDISLPIEPA